jgi:hypothetical protein
MKLIQCDNCHKTHRSTFIPVIVSGLFDPNINNGDDCTFCDINCFYLWTKKTMPPELLKNDP